MKWIEIIKRYLIKYYLKYLGILFITHFLVDGVQIFTPKGFLNILIIAGFLSFIIFLDDRKSDDTKHILKRGSKDERENK